MSASLVGSEMCIRDSLPAMSGGAPEIPQDLKAASLGLSGAAPQVLRQRQGRRQSRLRHRPRLHHPRRPRLSGRRARP
eukprot:12241620-Alexandrium_andersonii.AAC.1